MKINRKPLWPNRKTMARKFWDFLTNKIKSVNECDFHECVKIRGTTNFFANFFNISSLFIVLKFKTIK